MSERGQTLIERDRAHLWHPYTQMKTAPDPLPIVRGQGVYLYTEDGRRILDGISSWWVNIHGHAHPRLNAALVEQVRHPSVVELGTGPVPLRPATGTAVSASPGVDGEMIEVDPVTPGYFRALRSRLIRGRLFEETDRESSLLLRRELDDLSADQVAARRRPLDRDPFAEAYAQVVERLVDVELARFDLGVGQLEVVDVAELDLRTGLDRGDEGQRPAGLEIADLVDLRRQQRLDLALRLRLAPVARQQAVDHLALDVLGEAAADQLGRHLAAAEAGDPHALPELADDALGLGLHRRRRHLDGELLAPGAYVLHR